MSLSEITAKMIESAESFHGAHLETAVGLTGECSSNCVKLKN